MSNFLQLKKIIISVALCLHYFPETQSLPALLLESESLVKPDVSVTNYPANIGAFNKVIDASPGPTEMLPRSSSEIEEIPAVVKSEVGKETMRLQRADSENVEISLKEKAQYNAWKIFDAMMHIRQSLEYLNRIQHKRLRVEIMNNMSEDVLRNFMKREKLLDGIKHNTLRSEIETNILTYVRGGTLDPLEILDKDSYHNRKKLRDGIKHNTLRSNIETNNLFDVRGGKLDDYSYHECDIDPYYEYLKDEYNGYFMRAESIDASLKTESLDDENCLTRKGWIWT